MPQESEKLPTQQQAYLIHDGTIRPDFIYMENRLMAIIGISYDQMLDYYRKGLRYFQMSRKQRRQIVGSEYIRFVTERTRTWDGESKVPPPCEWE